MLIMAPCRNYQFAKTLYITNTFDNKKIKNKIKKIGCPNIGWNMGKISGN